MPLFQNFGQGSGFGNQLFGGIGQGLGNLFGGGGRGLQGRGGGGGNLLGGLGQGLQGLGQAGGNLLGGLGRGLQGLGQIGGNMFGGGGLQQLLGRQQPGSLSRNLGQNLGILPGADLGPDDFSGVAAPVLPEPQLRGDFGALGGRGTGGVRKKQAAQLRRQQLVDELTAGLIGTRTGKRTPPRR